MSDTPPEPFVPPEVDLRGYKFMPLYGDKLFYSETWIAASADAKVAALKLWWHAYAREVPAGSLPDNDQFIAEYAGYGVGVARKAWLKIRAQVMRGWIKCSDGRLYHRFVTGIVTEAFEYRNRDRHRTENARKARQLQRQSQSKASSDNGSVTDSTETVKTETVKTETEGQEQKPARTRATFEPDWLPPEWQEFEQHRKEKRAIFTPTARRAAIRNLDKWRERGYDIVAILRYSIDNGYTGLFEPKGRSHGAQPNKQESIEERNRRVTEAWTPPPDPIEVA